MRSALRQTRRPPSTTARSSRNLVATSAISSVELNGIERRVSPTGRQARVATATRAVSVLLTSRYQLDSTNEPAGVAWSTRNCVASAQRRSARPSAPKSPRIRVAVLLRHQAFSTTESSPSKTP